MSGVRHTLKHTIQLPLGAVMAATMCVAGGACFLALASTTQVLPRTIVAVGMFLAATLLTVTSALYLTDRLGREQRERERVERCLREALDALRCQKLALDAHAIVSETDADGWITYVNDRFCAISGFTRAEVIGQNHRCLNSAHHPRQFWADMYAKVAKDGIWHSEICNRAKDGSLYWEETTVVAFRDQRGKLARYVSVRTDITERKRAQAEAAKQRAHLELFVEHVPAPVAMFDREMRYIGHSRRWLTDYRLQDGIIGKSHYEVFPEIPERWKVIHRRCLAGAVERNDEDCFVRADGSRQWLRWEVRPWFMPDGQIGGIVMFTEDISESRAAAEKIAQSERLLRTILDVLPQRVFWKDRQGRYGGANQRFLADCGMSEVVGKDDYDMPWTREQSDFFRTCDQRVMETGVPEIEIIEPLSDAAGAAKWLSTSKVPLCNDAGEVVGVLGTSLDITRLKQLERDAEERLARLESAEAIARIGHWTWDPSTPQGHGSRQLYRLFGRDADRDTLSYAEVLALLVPQDSERLDAAVHRAVERGEGFGLQLQLRQEANGCEFLWVQAQVERDAQGKVQGLCGTTMDITERVRRERDLERARTAAEEGSRAKSEFLAAMSHEIRTPMNGVLGFTHLLLESSLDAEQRDFATTIKKSAEALLTIINDILDYSKIEAGKLTLEMVPCDILGAACDVVDLLEYRAVEKGLELALQADTDAMPQLIVDPGRVRQVLLNLVGNAIKFTADGHVLVELRTFRGSETEPGCVRVSVTDT
ncbi:MAG: PAS domain-containing protein, partial [Planctomycetota bacterium]